MKTIFNYEPHITEQEIDAVVNCFKKGIANPSHIAKSEKELERSFGLDCVLTSSGTAALHLTLITLGIGEGDEVLCPDLTFAATWNVIEYVGAVPVFVDCDPDTWCIDVSKIERHISEKTKAIISVDLFGNSCDYDAIRSICRRHDLVLIQDAAESLGTLYRDRNVLQFGDVACTSFNLNKIITSCGGGAVFSNSDRFLLEARNLANQNKVGSNYDYCDIGFNYRIGSLNAAMLVPQLARLDQILEAKKGIHNAYVKLLSDIEDITFQKVTKHCKSNRWINIVKFSSEHMRDKVHNSLKEKQIESKMPFKPASLVNWLQKKYDYSKGKNAKEVFEKSLILPSSTSLTKDQISVVCDIVRETIKSTK